MDDFSDTCDFASWGVRAIDHSYPPTLALYLHLISMLHDAYPHHQYRWLGIDAQEQGLESMFAPVLVLIVSFKAGAA